MPLHSVLLQVLAREQHIAVLESTVSDLQTQPPLSTTQQLSSSIDPTSSSKTLGTGKLNPLSSSTNALIKSASSLMTPSINVATQTTETGFALCIQCTDTHRTLAELAQTVSNVSSAHRLPSDLSVRDWVALVSIGGLEVGDWARRFKTDLEALSSHASSQESRVKELEGELMERKETLLLMEEEMESLAVHIKHLQVNNLRLF